MLFLKMKVNIILPRCGILFFSLLVAAVATAQNAIPIVQGVTSDTATQVLMQLPSGEPRRIELRDANNKLIAPWWQETKTGYGQPEQLVLIRYENLNPKDSYRLTIRNHSGKVEDERTLRTLDTKKNKARIAVASCSDDRYKKEQEGIWRELLQHKPDALFLIGDNVYADRRDGKKIKPSAETMYKRYLETRNMLALFKSKDLVPVFAVWDDHDSGINDGSKSHPFGDRAREIMGTFFPRTEIQEVYTRGPGVSAILTAFGQRFVFLDDRTYRDDQTQEHFGSLQQLWLKENIQQVKPTWLISGDQFFGGYHSFESYEGRHAKSFQPFLTMLKTSPSPVFFVSGDRHLTELMEIKKSEFGYDTYELTSSGIHVTTYPSGWDKRPNPRQIAGAAQTFNYAIVSTQTNPDWLMTITSYGPDKKILFNHEVSIKKP